MTPVDYSRPKLATRLSFLAAGFSMACWAPLVPYAKARVGADDRALGFILLCLGVGSIVAMPVTGWLSARAGSKPVIIGAGITAAMMLPLLALVSEEHLLAMALFGFGAGLGTLDVAMNIHAVEVEKAAKQPLMSNFHAMFSVGGFIGAGGMTVALSSGAAPFPAAIAGGLLTLLAIGLAWPRLLPARGEPTSFALPHGFVILLAFLGAVMFLVEGAILDWGALLMVETKLATAAHGGVGYMLFSIAMTVGRLSGDRIVARFGNRRVLVWGGLITIAGFVVLLTAPFALVAFAGFLLIGLGASNIVPVFFRAAGNQTVMPAALAVAALTTTGYAGVLMGPAMIGFVAHAVGLPAAFWSLAILAALVPLLARRVARD